MNKSAQLRRWEPVLLVVILAVLLVLILLAVWTARLKHDLSEMKRKSQLCPIYIPTRFALEEPDCANKLIKSLNISNVQILTTLTKNSSD